jgi:O-antigen/teichoic acid export membrane protein
MTARLLPSEARGLWLGLQLIFSYAQNLHLGVAYGMLRGVPLLRARGDEDGAERAKQTTWTFMLIMGGVGSLGLALFLVVSERRQERGYYLLTGVLALLTLLKSYYVCAFKGESRFRELSISAALGSATSLATVAFIWIWGLYGLILGMIAQTVVEAAWLVRKERIPRLGIDLRTLRELLVVGAQTLLTALGSVFLAGVDRTIMLSRFGATDTGNYYLGANIAVLLPVVASLPANVLTPRFFETYGATSSGQALVPLVERPARAGSVLFAAVLGMIAIAIPPGVAHVFPQLTAGNDAARLATLGTFPVVMAGLLVNVFYAMDRQLVQLILLVISAGAGFLSAHLAVLASPTLAAVAGGAAAGLFLYYVLLVLAAYALMLGRWTAGLFLLLESFAPAALAVLLVLVLDRTGSRFLPDGSLVRGFVSEGVFCVCFIPWVLRAARQLGVRARPARADPPL